jgi:hypothetical protein
MGELIVFDYSNPHEIGGIVKEYAQKFENIPFVSRRGEKLLREYL